MYLFTADVNVFRNQVRH